MADKPPLPPLLSPTVPRIIHPRHSRTPSRSPTRPRIIDDLLSGLSPSTTLEAFKSPTGKLKVSWEAASSYDQEFALRAATASHLIQQWVNELQSWQWPKGSAAWEAPPATPGSGDSHSGQGQYIRREQEDGRKDLQCGSLLQSQIELYEQRIDDIQGDMEDFDMDGIKSYVQGQFSAKSRPSSSGSNAHAPTFLNSATYNKMDDLTAVVTKTVLEALPNLSMLNYLLKVWNWRIYVLRKVPLLTAALEAAELALKNAWDIIGPVNRDAPLDWKSYGVLKSVLMKMFHGADAHFNGFFNDLDEAGKDDVSLPELPDAWITRIDDVESECKQWTVTTEARLRKADLEAAEKTRRQKEEATRLEEEAARIARLKAEEELRERAAQNAREVAIRAAKVQAEKERQEAARLRKAEAAEATRIKAEQQVREAAKKKAMEEALEAERQQAELDARAAAKAREEAEAAEAAEIITERQEREAAEKAREEALEATRQQAEMEVLAAAKAKEELAAAEAARIRAEEEAKECATLKAREEAIEAEKLAAEEKAIETTRAKHQAKELEAARIKAEEEAKECAALKEREEAIEAGRLAAEEKVTETTRAKHQAKELEGARLGAEPHTRDSPARETQLALFRRHELVERVRAASRSSSASSVSRSEIGGESLLHTMSSPVSAIQPKNTVSSAEDVAHRIPPVCGSEDVFQADETELASGQNNLDTESETDAHSEEPSRSTSRSEKGSELSQYLDQPAADVSSETNVEASPHPADLNQNGVAQLKEQPEMALGTIATVGVGMAIGAVAALWSRSRSASPITPVFEDSKVGCECPPFDGNTSDDEKLALSAEQKTANPPALDQEVKVVSSPEVPSRPQSDEDALDTRSLLVPVGNISSTEVEATKEETSPNTISRPVAPVTRADLPESTDAPASPSARPPQLPVGIQQDALAGKSTPSPRDSPQSNYVGEAVAAPSVFHSISTARHSPAEASYDGAAESCVSANDEWEVVESPKVQEASSRLARATCSEFGQDAAAELSSPPVSLYKTASLASVYAPSDRMPELYQAEPTEYFRSPVKSLSSPVKAAAQSLGESSLDEPELSTRSPMILKMAEKVQDWPITKMAPVLEQTDAHISHICSSDGGCDACEEIEKNSQQTPVSSSRPTASQKSSIARFGSAIRRIPLPRRESNSSDTTVITNLPLEVPSSPVSTPVSGSSATFPESYQDSPSAGRIGHRDTAYDISPPASPKARATKPHALTLLKSPDFMSSDPASPTTPLEAPILEGVYVTPDALDAPVMGNVRVSTEPALTSPKKASTEAQIQQQISTVLKTVPARIRLTTSSTPTAKTKPIPFTSNNLHPQKVRRSLTPSLRSSSTMSNYSTTSESAGPSFTLAPSRARHQSSNAETKLYHLSRSNGDGPVKVIKLLVRLVGENGERVMVRVGGGWADLGEYLKAYASHHGRRTAIDGEDLVEIQDLPSRIPSSSSTTSNATIRPSSRHTPLPSRPASVMADRPGSSLYIRKTRKSFGEKSSSSEQASAIPSHISEPQRYPSTPLPTLNSRPFSATPPSIESSGGRSSRMSSSAGWDEEDSSLGLAGPKGKKVNISERDMAWVDSMKEKVRLASAEKEKKERDSGNRERGNSFGEMGRVGGTKRLFRKSEL